MESRRSKRILQMAQGVTEKQGIINIFLNGTPSIFMDFRNLQKILTIKLHII